MTEYESAARSARWLWRFGRLSTEATRQTITRSIDALSDESHHTLTELGQILSSDAMSRVRTAIQSPLGEAVRRNHAEDIEGSFLAYQRAQRIHSQHAEFLRARQASQNVIADMDAFIEEHGLQSWAKMLPFCTLRAVHEDSPLLSDTKLSHAVHCARWLRREFAYWCHGREAVTKTAQDALSDYREIPELGIAIARLSEVGCYRLAEIIGEQHVRLKKSSGHTEGSSYAGS